MTYKLYNDILKNSKTKDSIGFVDKVALSSPKSNLAALYELARYCTRIESSCFTEHLLLSEYLRHKGFIKFKDGHLEEVENKFKFFHQVNASYHYDVYLSLLNHLSPESTASCSEKVSSIVYMYEIRLTKF